MLMLRRLHIEEGASKGAAGGGNRDPLPPARGAPPAGVMAGDPVTKGSGESIRSVEVNEGKAVERQRRPQMDAEHGRLEEARTKSVPWKKWGPYL